MLNKYRLLISMGTFPIWLFHSELYIYCNTVYTINYKWQQHVKNKKSFAEGKKGWFEVHLKWFGVPYTVPVPFPATLKWIKHGSFFRSLLFTSCASPWGDSKITEVAMLLSRTASFNLIELQRGEHTLSLKVLPKTCMREDMMYKTSAILICPLL